MKTKVGGRRGLISDGLREYNRVGKHDDDLGCAGKRIGCLTERSVCGGETGGD